MVTEKEDVLNKAWHLEWDGPSFGNSKVWMVLVLTHRDLWIVSIVGKEARDSISLKLCP